MFKNLPKGVKLFLYIFVSLLVIFIIFSASVHFLDFPFSGDFVKQQLMLQPTDQFPPSEDLSPATSNNDSEYSPWAALIGESSAKDSSTKEYFEGFYYYREEGGVKKILGMSGTIALIEKENGVVRLTGTDGSSENIPCSDKDILFIRYYDKNGVMLEQKEVSVFELAPGDFVSYNPAGVDGRTVPIWVLNIINK